MSTLVRIAPVGAGKTEAALNRLLTTIRDSEKPFAKAWVLLATKRQEVAFRQRLTELGRNQTVYFNIEFFNFYELNQRLLNLAGKPPRRIHQAARLGILRMLLDELQRSGELDTFHDIALTAGFIRVVADFIYELKQNRVFPQQFQAAAQTAKDRELSLIYTRYQDLVQEKELVDREGEGWLALQYAEEQPYLASDVDLLLVDGYDQFTPVQAALLARLSDRIASIEITLTTIPKRETDFGRRFNRSLQRLAQAHDRAETDFYTESLEITFESRPHDLNWLSQNIFQRNVDPQPTEGHIRLIEAPDPQQEVGAVLRLVKRHLLEGVRPDDIVIAIRDWGRYQSHFETYQRAYDVPLLLHYTEALEVNPAIAVFLNVLELAPEFRRRDLLDVLRSPYIHVEGLDAEQVDLLDRISREQHLIGGSKDVWLGAIDLASEEWDDEDGEPVEPILSREQASELSLSLQTFMDNITPDTRSTIDNYIEWLENLIGQEEQAPDEEPYEAGTGTDSLGIAAAIQQSDSSVPEYIQIRDVAAVSGLKRIFQGFLSTQALLRATVGEPPMLFWGDFFSRTEVGCSRCK